MSNGRPGPGPAPILHRVGLAGALARFYQRSYAADYIALGFLALGWVTVSWNYLYTTFLLARLLFICFRIRSNSWTHSTACFLSTTKPSCTHSPSMSEFQCVGLPRTTFKSSVLISYLVWSVIYAGVIPFLIIMAWSAMLRPGVQRTQVTVLGLLVALMLTSFLTDVVKNAVGRPRPDLLSRCKPSRGTKDNVLVAWTVCTESNQHILQEGWRSFPSGHSSFAFAGLGYLSL